jgi:hypothetical protein
MLGVYLNSLFKSRKVKCPSCTFQWLELPVQRIRMENKISLVLVLIAGASLVSMLATLRIDGIVNHDLYSYGLRFSIEWAAPYWTMAAIVFSMGWFIILTSIAFEARTILRLRFRWRLRARESLGEAETASVSQEAVQEETACMEAEPSGEPEKEEVTTTALAVKKDEKDELSEFRVLLEEISVMTSATPARKKADDRQTDEK